MPFLETSTPSSNTLCQHLSFPSSPPTEEGSTLTPRDKQTALQAVTAHVHTLHSFKVRLQYMLGIEAIPQTHQADSEVEKCITLNPPQNPVLKTTILNFDGVLQQLGSSFGWLPICEMKSID